MAMRVCVLGSGSGGNCTLVDSGDTRILVDAGRLGYNYIEMKLASIGVRIKDIDAVVVTHAHGDHVDGGTTMPVCQRHDTPLLAHEETVPDILRRSKRFEKLQKAGLLQGFDGDFSIGRVTVRPFRVPHGRGWNEDCVGRPVGFVFEHGNDGAPARIGVTTDLGYLPGPAEDLLVGVDALVIESNHDVARELSSPRPDFLVRWVIGPRGHMSNEQAADAVTRIVTRGNGRTRRVVLAHISRDCNDPELALATSRRRLDESGYPSVELIAASQKERTSVVETA